MATGKEEEVTEVGKRMAETRMRAETVETMERGARRMLLVVEEGERPDPLACHSQALPQQSR